MNFRYLPKIIYDNNRTENAPNIFNSRMTKIYNHMFENSYYINELEIPHFITEIDDNAFINCPRIKTIKCDPKWLKLLPNPLNIENIIVIDGIESIERDSFRNCHNVKFLSLPSSLKFDRCDHTIFNEIDEIQIFSGDPKFLSIIKKEKLTKVFIPSSIKEIPANACAGCKNLQEVHVSQDTQLELIGPLAFDDCSSLNLFTIPNTVENIAPNAFQGCISYNLIFQNDTQMLSMIDNLIITENEISQYYGLYVNITSLEIPFEIQECEPGILNRFKKLKKVKCNPKLLNLFCTDAIEFVNVPFGICQIKREDFSNLIHLKFIEIPDSIDLIENNSFSNCRELTSVKCGIKHLQYLNKNLIKEIQLNEQVTQINENDFEGFVNLESCLIPDSVVNIHPNSFNNCRKLKTINHPNGASLIKNQKSIDSNTVQILKNDFSDWTNLIKLNIPSTVETIEDDTFANCISLEYLICDPKWYPYIPKISIKTIVIPNYIKKIERGQFDEFSSLMNIKLPNDLIIEDPCIFDLCENLQIIKCSSEIFEFLSKKTRKRCIEKLRQKYKNPIFNIQTESNVFDETDLFNDINSIFDDTTDNKQIITTETTIDDLIKYDISYNKYKSYINDIISCIQSDEINFTFDQNNTSISEISKLCSLIFNKIYKSLNIIPKSVQICSILRLADELLNNKSHGSVAEIKPGEGKTFIISILSIILVKFGHSVDIVNSNLQLSNQNKNEQSKIYELFNISTSVFLNNKSKENEDNNNSFKKYDESEFDDNNLKAFESPVVFSTNFYFECYYLHTIHDLIPRKRQLDIVIIDEIENFLENEFPSIVPKEINYLSISNILSIIYCNRLLTVTDIINILKIQFPNMKEFKYDIIELFKIAALKADQKIKDIDYRIENNKIVVLNGETGLEMPNYRWPNYIYEMVEIKEKVDQISISLLHNQITHQTYFNIYNKIACVTENIGNKYDQKIIKKYNIDIFKVPRNILSQTKIFYKVRPSSIEEVFDLTLNEIICEKNKGNPVLVVWDTKINFNHFNEFLRSKELDFEIIADPENESIGESGLVSSMPSFEIRKIKKNGVHVIIPMRIKNLSLFEQAISKGGQTGSITIFVNNSDLITKPIKFDYKNNNLVLIERKFADFLIRHFQWLFARPKKNQFEIEIKFLISSDYLDILNVLSRHIFLLFKEETKYSIKTNQELSGKFKDLVFIMIQTVWSSFFTEIQNDALSNDSAVYCEKRYNRFIKDLNSFVNSYEIASVYDALKYIKSVFNDEFYLESLVYKNYEISISSIDFIFESDQEGSNEIAQFSFNWFADKLNEFTKYMNDNKKNLPSKHLLNKSPKINLNCVNISLIKLALQFACEAYNIEGSFSNGNVIFSSKENDIFKPVFYCIEHENKLFVATRGSDSPFDWTTDFTCYEVCEQINEFDVYFHKGFLSAANYIFDNISNILDRDYEEIYFIGHSYAAAVSNVLCLLAKTDNRFKHKRIFSFAFAPPPSMSRIPGYIQDCMFLFINNQDIIPHLSLKNIQNTINLKSMTTDVFVDYAIDIFHGFNSDYANDFADSFENNKGEITKSLNSEKVDLHVQKNIGNIFYLGISESRKLKNCQIDESDLPNTVFITPLMFTHHTVNEYVKSLKKIQSYA